MTIDRSVVIRQLESAADYPLAEALTAWLKREDTRLVSNRSASVSVSETLRLWTTRLKNTDVTGQTLEGAELLIAKLQSLTKQKLLENFAFTGPEAIANVFLEHASHQFVGAIWVKTSRERREVTAA